LRGGELSAGRAAVSVAIGLFIGSLPIYGLHLPLCLALCLPLRLDVLVAYVAANISNPLIAPFLISAEIQLGSLLLRGELVPFDVERAKELGIAGFAAQAAVGSVVLGGVLASIGGVVAYAAVFAYGARKDRALISAIRRTVLRYGGATRSERVYVALKLQTDPVLRCLAREPSGFGRLLDAGSGRGQLALCLLELGKAETVFGFDWHTNKVTLAKMAARGDGQFVEADLRSAPWRRADTILLVDVLHYLSRQEQNNVLARALEHLAPGGRLYVREVDAERGWRSRLTRCFERLAKRVGVNRGLELSFRSTQEIVAELERHGASVKTMPAAQNTPLANVLIVAEKPAQQLQNRHAVQSLKDTSTRS
jgi:uncharacterized protein (DUF2062 family)/16S rRNA G1207 methylase RsmC